MRTIIHFMVGIALGGPVALSQDVEPVSVPNQSLMGQARLGLTVSKPDDTTATQLPSLPPGIGFVVSELEAKGPAEQAGVRVFDLLWKMNEQMLVNEGQLATLLRLSKPGDQVTLSVFREGKSLDLKVKLGETKDDGALVIRNMLNDSVMRKEDGALRIVNIEQKKAAFSNENGTAEVYRVESGDAVRIVDTEGNVVFEAVVKGRPELSMVPDGWRRQVCALRRGLDHALSAKAAPMRQPRPRIVPPAPVQTNKQGE